MRSRKPSSHDLGNGALVLFGLLQAACAHGKSPPRTIAIVPIDVLGVPPGQGEELSRALETELGRQPQNRLVRRDAVRAALPEGEGTCAEAESCLIEVGRRLSADLVLSLRLAGLGDTHVLRARLFDVDRGILIKDLQETGGGGEGALATHARSVSRRMFPPPGEPSRWWLWSGLAALAAATATIVIVSEGDPDVIHVGDL